MFVEYVEKHFAEYVSPKTKVSSDISLFITVTDK
jgi:hypothetical protein